MEGKEKSRMKILKKSIKNETATIYFSSKPSNQHLQANLDKIVQERLNIII